MGRRERERCVHTVNSEIFARVLFSRVLADAKFRENFTLAKWQNHTAVYGCRNIVNLALVMKV